MKKRIRQWLPWLVTVGILWFLLDKYDPEAVWAAMKGADLLFLLPLWISAVFIVFLADAGCLIHLFRICKQPVSMTDLFWVKGASYLLNVINYNAAAGGIGYFVSRRTGTPLLKALSSMLMLSGIDLLALAMFVTGAYALSPDYLPVEYASPILWTCAVLFFGYLSVTVIWKMRGKLSFLNRVFEWEILHCMRATRTRDQLGLIVIRFFFMSLYFITQYLSLQSFGIDIPFIELCGYNAILTLVGIIPISIAGFGTTQWAMVVLYTPFVVAGVTTAVESGMALSGLPAQQNAEALILAYSTSIMTCFVFLRVCIGYFCFARLSQDLKAGFAGPDVADLENTAQ